MSFFPAEYVTDTAQIWSGVKTFAAGLVVAAGMAISFGASPAASGAARFTNGDAIKWKNGGSDISAVTISGNSVTFGDAVNGGDISISTSTSIIHLKPSNTGVIYWSASDMHLEIPAFTIDVGVVNPLWKQTARTSDVAPSNWTLTPQGPFTTAVGANRVPGSLIVDLSVPTNGGTTEGFFTVQRAGVSKLSLGYQAVLPITGASGGVIAAPGHLGITSAGGGGIIINSNGALYYQGTAINGYVGATQVVSLAQAVGDFQAFGAIPSATGAIRLSNNFGVYGRDSANNGDVGLVTLDASDRVLVNFPNPAGGATLIGGGNIQLYTSGGTQVGTAGSYSSVGDFRFSNATTIIAARNAANSANILVLRTDGGNSVIVGDTAGTAGLSFQCNNANVMSFSPGGTTLFNIGGGALYITNTALLFFVSTVASPQFYHQTAASDVVTTPLTIQPQFAFATATGANRKPGDLVVNLGSPTNSGVTEANVLFRRNGSTFATFRADGLLNLIDLTATSFLSLYYDGATHVQGGHGTMYVDNGSGVIQLTSNDTYVVGTTAVNLYVAGVEVSRLTRGAGDHLDFGANTASIGTIRLANSIGIAGRNGANSGDISLLFVDGSNHVFIGGNASFPSNRLQNVVNVVSDVNLYLQNASATGLSGIAFTDDAGTPQTSFYYDIANSKHIWNVATGKTMELKVNGTAFAVMTVNGIQLFTTAVDFAGGVGVLGVHNCTAAPTGNPTNGFVLYAEGGAGKIVGGSGTITTIAAADPHCTVCGLDFANEWVSPKGVGRAEHAEEHHAVCSVCRSDWEAIVARVLARLSPDDADALAIKHIIHHKMAA